jgi:restriction system protein
MDRVWKVHAGEGAAFVQEFLSRSIVAIGWRELGDLTTVHSRDEIAELVEHVYPDQNPHQRSASVGQIFRFRNDLMPGRLVMTYDPTTRVYHVGAVSGEYEYRPDLIAELPNIRPVSWTKDIDRDSLTSITKNSLGSIATVFCVSEEASIEIAKRIQNVGMSPAMQSTLEEVEDDDSDVLKGYGAAIPGVLAGSAQQALVGGHAGTRRWAATSDGLSDSGLRSRKRSRQGHYRIAGLFRI